MVACVLIPGFELRAALRAKPSLTLCPAALAPAEGEEPLLGSVTAAAEAKGVKPGMRMGEALATCPELVLVDQDPSAAEQAWEEILRRLEDCGFAVESGFVAALTSATFAVVSGGATAAIVPSPPAATTVLCPLTWAAIASQPGSALQAVRHARGSAAGG